MHGIMGGNDLLPGCAVTVTAKVVHQQRVAGRTRRLEQIG